MELIKKPFYHTMLQLADGTNLIVTVGLTIPETTRFAELMSQVTDRIKEGLPYGAAAGQLALFSIRNEDGASRFQHLDDIEELLVADLDFLTHLVSALRFLVKNKALSYAMARAILMDSLDARRN